MPCAVPVPCPNEAVWPLGGLSGKVSDRAVLVFTRSFTWGLQSAVWSLKSAEN